MTRGRFIAWFADIRKDDVSSVGGKGANLGEMTAAGFPVPPGFVVTANAYRHFLQANNLEKKIAQLLATTSVSDVDSFQQASVKIKKLLHSSPVPPEVALEIIAAYQNLAKHMGAKSRLSRVIAKLSMPALPVAVRSSATAEDSKTASFAGQNETFLNIVGESTLVDYVRQCWASLFDGRSIFYREQQHIDHFKSAIAVIVQVMVQSDISGIAFSIDPVTNNKQRIVIEASYGLGEYIVQGKVTPDHYEVNKSDLKIVEKRVVPQKIMLVRNKGGGVVQKSVAKNLADRPKLSDEQITTVAKLVRALESHYYFPQDSEFAVSGGTIYLVQTRPITTTQIASSGKETATIDPKKSPILEGSPASPGIRSGPVKILKSAKEIGLIKPGDVLVAEQTNPDYVPAMKKAIAIVTEKGGRTSHAAIVSRELGIPCVVGVDRILKILKNGQVITVNGSTGKIYVGAVAKSTTVTPSSKPDSRLAVSTTLHTATKVYVNLAEPEKAKEVAAKDCDGVGLLRAEFMIAGIGLHPKVAIKEKKQQLYIDSLANQLTIFAQAFYPRPVVFRSTDFKTNEYRSLRGGAEFEPEEENPMIGFRGAYRYITQPDVFRLEIEAIKKVRGEHGFTNLHLMIPFCRTIKELVEVKELLTKAGLHRSTNFKLWMMCEIPSNVILLDKFIEVGLDGISVGSNDLTMLTLGVDRDNANVAGEYNELDPAMLFSFYKIIKTCQKYHVTCSICGQAPSDFPELTEKLVKWGITSVSVNPDVLSHTRQVVYEAEKKLVSK